MIESKNDFSKDIKKILFHYLSFYKIFIFLVISFLIITYFYNKTLVPVYTNTTKIHLVKDLTSFFTTDFSFETSLATPQMGMRYGIGLDDELTMLNSYDLVQKTLKQLELEVTYFKKQVVFPKIPLLKNKVKHIELYEGVPIKINYDASHPQPIYKEFSLEILSDSTCKLMSLAEGGNIYNYIDSKYLGELDGKQVNGQVSFGNVVENEYMKFQIRKTDAFQYWPKGSIIYFYFNNIEYLTLDLRGRMGFSQPLPTSFIIDIGITGTNFEKITAFLNAYSNNILDNDLSQKNDLAISTINFIDSQLGDISDSLRKAKINLEQFRSTNKVTDLSYQGQRLFDQLATIEEEKETLKMQERYYKYLTDYIKKSNSKELISPASMSVIDPLLSSMIAQLSTYYSQYKNYSESSTSTIYLSDLRIKIKNLESSILENASNNLSTIQLSISELDYRLDNINALISKLPKTELKLIEIERKFKLNDAVLTFLMQKRSEAQIAMASTKPSYEIIEPARLLSNRPIAPKKSLNYIIAFFLGIFLPFLYILISDFLDNKVRDKYNIKNFDNYNFLGNIHRNNNKTPLCVLNHPNSIISESFRAVRTNIQFMMDYSDSRIISVTSASSGEGKSFFAANMATSYAANGYKTVLLEFDLRRPQIGKLFNVNNNLGLTSCLSNTATFDDIIVSLDNVQDLDLILAGTKAPNPADLVVSEKVNMLFEFLKSEYDIIVVDTAPVGVVSESYYLIGLSDLCVYVVRQDFSNIELTNDIIEQVNKVDLKECKFALVLNDVSGKSISSYHQSAYRKYYLDEESKKGFFRRHRRN